MTRTRCTLPARMQDLPRATAFVEDFCRRQGIAENDRLRLALITEELFTNTVAHGVRGDGEIEVRIELSAAPAQITMIYEDSARRFDPLARAEHAVANLDEAIAAGSTGGFGLVLIAKLAAQTSYVRTGEWNRLSVVLARGR